VIVETLTTDSFADAAASLSARTAAIADRYPLYAGLGSYAAA